MIKKHRRPAALLLGCLLFPAITAAQVSKNDTGDDEKEAVKLEVFEVLGSRVKRPVTETSSPVQVFTAARIEALGYDSIADAIRSLPAINGASLTPVAGGTSLTPGVQSFNLRSLGNNNTLVLINGRRAVPFALPGYNRMQTVFDLNSIPGAAIESMTILKDGGSALYGSDAVTGVIDFKLKNAHDGATLTAQIGNYLVTDGFFKKGAVVSGIENGRTHLLFAADWSEQNAVFSRDLSRTASADKTAIARKTNAHYEAPRPLSDYGNYTNPVDDGRFDTRSNLGFPGYVAVPGLGGTLSFPAATDNPAAGNAISKIHYYDTAQETELFPDTRHFSFYTWLRQDFSARLHGFAEISFARAESWTDVVPAQVNLSAEHGLDSDSPMIIPAYNAYNPWGVDIASGRRRIVETGNRTRAVTSETPRLVAGLGGSIGGDWTWEAAALYTKNDVTNITQGAITDYRMQQALMGLTRMGDGSLAWNPGTATGDRVYFNWFGKNEKAFGDFLAIDNPVVAALEFRSYDVKAAGSLFDLPGGRAGFAFGAERRSEKLSVTQTDLSATGNLVAEENRSVHGQRDINALYAEATLPVFAWLEAQIAGRLEDYSDAGIKNRVRPKAGLKLKPLPWLTVRASCSEAFKAPDLPFLYTTAATTYTLTPYTDPVTGVTDRIQIRFSGNPELKPERSNVYYAGIAVEPKTGPLAGFFASADFFYYDQKDLFGKLVDYYSYSYFLLEAQAGNPRFVSKVVRGPGNELLYVLDDYSNIFSVTHTGWDFEAGHRWKTERSGEFLARVSGTYLIRHKWGGPGLGSTNMVGTYLTTRFNAAAELLWKYRDWTLNVAEIYKGGRSRDELVSYLTDPDVDGLYLIYDVKAQYRTNASLTYSGFRRMRVTVGATNIFNQSPVADPLDTIGVQNGVNFVAPAFWYLRVARDF
ncbi:MAG: TonB-dependent receptor [Opitutaceae bacterium]|jgi:outer membrane receptor protein involved in Fe transport|nr:TonB-dependent receptor [Opitutaceae bacterium]